MPKPRNPKLDSPTARAKLAPAKKPYWTTIAPGISLGYRRNEGAGTWSVRVIGHGATWIKRLAIADDLEKAAPPTVLGYWQAIDEARKLARQEPGAPVDDSRPVTVGEALDGYELDLKARGADIANVRRPRKAMPSALLEKPVQLLTAGELKRWRNSLVGGIASKGRAPASVNRMVKGLRAALVQAGENDPRIRNQAEFKIGLKPLPGAGRARNIILTDTEVRAFVAAAYALNPALGLLFDVLAVTGTRPSQAIRLTVADLQADPRSPRLLIPRSGKGGNRDRIERKTEQVPVPITLGLAHRLQAAAAGRPATALLLCQGDGSTWPREPLKHYNRRKLVQSIGLDPAEVTTYALRHSAIVRQLLANVPIRLIAAQCDTSVAMIESNYSKHIASHGDELSRRGLLADEAPADNIVAFQKKEVDR
jgi:integrase